MELAAVGVSIAVFNQVSRITIFPLVSVTTSFVAEEETIGKLNAEAQEDENLEKGFTTNKEMEELIHLVSKLSYSFSHMLLKDHAIVWLIAFSDKGQMYTKVTLFICLSAIFCR